MTKTCHEINLAEYLNPHCGEPTTSLGAMLQEQKDTQIAPPPFHPCDDSSHTGVTKPLDPNIVRYSELQSHAAEQIGKSSNGGNHGIQEHPLQTRKFRNLGERQQALQAEIGTPTEALLEPPPAWFNEALEELKPPQPEVDMATLLALTQPPQEKPNGDNQNEHNDEPVSEAPVDVYVAPETTKPPQTLDEASNEAEPKLTILQRVDQLIEGNPFSFDLYLNNNGPTKDPSPRIRRSNRTNVSHAIAIIKDFEAVMNSDPQAEFPKTEANNCFAEFLLLTEPGTIVEILLYAAEQTQAPVDRPRLKDKLLGRMETKLQNNPRAIGAAIKSVISEFKDYLEKVHPWKRTSQLLAAKAFLHLLANGSAK